MNWTLKKLAPLENNYELIFGVLVIPLSAIFYMGLSYLPSALIPKCHFHSATGIPCPTCGATRAIHLLSTGNFIEAWLMQPLLTTITVISILYSIYSYIVVLGKLPRLRLINISRKNRNHILIICGTLFFLNWIYLIFMGI